MTQLGCVEGMLATVMFGRRRKGLNHTRRIFAWQFGALGLTEDGGNRIIKYSDAINHGVRIACLLPRIPAKSVFVRLLQTMVSMLLCDLGGDMVTI